VPQSGKRLRTADGLAVQLGGAGLDRQGARAVPSLRYVLNRTPVWHKNSPRAGRTADRRRGAASWWIRLDGRFNTLHEQAAFPLLAANEMANASAEEVSRSCSAHLMGRVSPDVWRADFDEPRKAFAEALIA